jgi:hypothetical protein
LFSADFPPAGMPYAFRDGKKFVVYAGETGTSAPITLVLHWDAGLKR